MADHNTPIPEGSGNFTSFDKPVISGSNVAFRDDLGQLGIYLFNGTSLIKIADTNTPLPGGSGNFVDFINPVISGSNVAFIGLSAAQGGIYFFNGTSLMKVADTNTHIPEGVGNFIYFRGVEISGGNIVFEGFGTDQYGIYFFNGTNLIKVADLNTPVPAGVGNFTGFVPDSSRVSGSNVIFQGGWISVDSLGQAGIYLGSPPTPTVSIPSSSEWGLAILSFLIGVSGLNLIHKHISKSQREGAYIYLSAFISNP